VSEGELLETLDLQTGQRIRQIIVNFWNMAGSKQNIMLKTRKNKLPYKGHKEGARHECLLIT